MFISCLGVDLASSFSTEALLPLLADKELQKRLLPFLPAVENLPESEDELRQTIQSPQFKQVGRTFQRIRDINVHLNWLYRYFKHVEFI